MLKNGEKFSTVFKLILLSLMLAVQSLSIAHELSHHQAADAEYCSICSGPSGSEALAQLETVTQLPQCPLYLATGQLAEIAGEGQWPDWLSRAPPAHP